MSNCSVLRVLFLRLLTFHFSVSKAVDCSFLSVFIRGRLGFDLPPPCPCFFPTPAKSCFSCRPTLERNVLLHFPVITPQRADEIAAPGLLAVITCAFAILIIYTWTHLHAIV